MGFEYFKRPLRVQSAVASTFEDITVEGTLTLQSDMVLPVETLTGSGALQNIASTAIIHAITQGTSGSGRDFRLPTVTAGAVHIIAVNGNTTSPNDVVIQCNTTAQTFFGTTANTVGLANSTTAGTDVRTLMLVGISTSQWIALGQGSTAYWVFTASTGSTGQ